MLHRSIAALALCALASCQDYNFNPVGKCVIQPGSSRVQLASTATADILFVVDDSGSMAPEQARLARNFNAFITSLAKAQTERVANGLEPFEFHVPVTPSAIFESWVPCLNPTCTGSPLSCNIQFPVSNWSPQYSEACDQSGAACHDVITSYYQCSANPSVNGTPYPSGDFVAAGSNPRVLHFTKTLNWKSGTSDPAIADLITKFQQNITVGTCGSGMEQHLEAGRLALEKALRQNGLSQPVGVDPNEWPHANSKLVVVWVGDEDDCSNPKDATRSLAFGSGTAAPGNDVCTADETAASPKQFPVQSYADFFTNLGRPFGAAFIYSAQLGSCTKDANGNVVCSPGKCICQCPTSCASCGSGATGDCQIPSNCGGQIPLAESRFHQLSAAFRLKGANTFEASVCDADFAATLEGIADLVKPPPGLTLPTQPASTEVAVLRIESADGTSSRYCTGPGQGLDWGFVQCATGGCGCLSPTPVPDGVTTSCININHATNHCEANAGETYIAQYLGLVPEGGCATAGDCFAKLGGQSVADWQCSGVTATQRGTCLCANN